MDPCVVCFTVSWVPVADESECALVHPHEGEHMRCDHCWVRERLNAANERAERLREAMEIYKTEWYTLRAGMVNQSRILGHEAETIRNKDLKKRIEGIAETLRRAGVAGRTKAATKEVEMAVRALACSEETLRADAEGVTDA